MSDTDEKEKQPASEIPPENWDSIQYWQKKIMAWAESKGWNQGLDERSFGDWITLMHTELSEAYEDYRAHHKPNEIYFEDGSGNKRKYTGQEVAEVNMVQRHNHVDVTQFKPCGIPIEIADLAIRMFHFAEYFDFDLTQMIAMKMAYNEKRPFRHGGKKV